MVEREVRDRIRELRRVKASELVANPELAPPSKEQSAAMRGLLNEIGYAGALLARDLSDDTLQLIDGHLRLETTPKATVPVLVLDVTEAEADKILLTFDPISALAQADQWQMEALLATVRTENTAVAAMFERVAGESAWQVAESPALDRLPVRRGERRNRPINSGDPTQEIPTVALTPANG